jgi:TP901 family phage tail tape measure protein
MADDIRSNIIIGVDTSVGIAEIKNLQRQISQLNAQLLQSGAQQAQAAQNIQRNLINNINATGKFAANVKTISTTAESFTTSLERNKLSMGEYFRYAGASTKTFGRLFKSEFSTIEKVARERVKTLQTQFIKLGRDGSGAMKAIAVRPLALDMNNLATKTALAAQKQQLFNQLVRQGSTNLLNFGKNTQWAGRQLMVGFTIPLTYLGVAAGKTFMKMEEQAIRFKKVYGDMFTTDKETEKALADIKKLGDEFTKYGIAVEKTLETAAAAAQAGFRDLDLQAQVIQSARLSILGGVEQEDALKTTIALQNAFRTSSDDLAKSIDFLNTVENQTVLSLEDVSAAIPRVGPIITELGGDIKDLAFFLAAMKEGGVSAAEGANALKSGLGRLINPSRNAVEYLSQFNINLSDIIEKNAGDLKGTVLAFAQAIEPLDDLSRTRAVEKVFGKFQFARTLALLNNITRDGTQAQKVLKLTAASTEELAILAEREMKVMSDSPMYKFKKAIEDLKVALVPLGEAFVKAITPVAEFAKGFLDKFNEMGDGAKNFAVVATTVIAGIGPLLLMSFGLVANGVANLIKLFAFLGKIFMGAGQSSKDLGVSTEYMTQQQLEAAAVASSLDQSHAKLIQTFNVEAVSVDKLAQAYSRAVVAQSRLLRVPIGPRNPAGQAPMKLNSGIISVPGPKGAGDVVPAMLSPGEAVIPAKQSEKYSGFIRAMINDSVPGFRIGRLGAASKSVRGSLDGGFIENLLRSLTGHQRTVSTSGLETKFAEAALRRPGKGVAVRMFSDDLVSALGRGDKRYKNVFETKTQSRGSLDTASGQREIAENRLFGFGPNTDPSKRPAYGYLFNRDLPQINYGKKSLADKLYGEDSTRGGMNPRFRAQDSITEAMSIMNPKTYRYGDIAMVLKNRALRGRTTITQGDSLNSRLDKYATPAKLGTRNRDAIRAAMTSGRGQRDFFEAQILGGFSFKDIKRIVATEPETIARLQASLKAAGIRGVRVGMPKMKMMQRIRAALRMGPKYPTKIPRMQDEGPYKDKYWTDPLVLNGRKFYKKGTLSVPGPKGKGDIVPAMLEPGEAVIPADMAERYRGLVGAIIKGDVNGYSRGTVAAGATPGLVRAHLSDDLDPRDPRVLAQLRAIYGPSVTADTFANYKVVGNLTADLPQSINTRLPKSRGGVPIQEFLRVWSGTENKLLSSAIAAGLPENEATIRQTSQLEKRISARLRAIARLQGSSMVTDDMLSLATREELARIQRSRPNSPLASLASSFEARAQNVGGVRMQLDRSAGLADKQLRDQIKSGQLAIRGRTVYDSASPSLRAARFVLPGSSKAAPGTPEFKKRKAATENLDQLLKRVSSGQATLDDIPYKLKPNSSSGTQFANNYEAQPIRGRLLPEATDKIIGSAMNKKSRAASPAKETVKASENLVDGAVKGIEDGAKKAEAAGKKVATAYVDGTERVYKTAGGQFRDRATKKRLPEAEAQRLMALDRQNERRRSTAELARQSKLRRESGISQSYGMSAAKFDKLSKDEQQALRAQRKQTAATEKQERIKAKNERLATERKVAEEKRKLALKEEKRQARSEKFKGMGGRIAGGVGAAAMVGVMGASMMGGQVGEIAQQLMFPAMMLPMILPMLMNPIGLAVAAIGGLAVAAFMLNEQFKKNIKESYELTMATGGSAKSLKAFSELSGKVSAGEIMDRRREAGVDVFQIAAGKSEFGQSFLQSEPGQELQQNVGKNIEKIGRSGSIKALVNQMSIAIASGALSAEQARSIVATLGAEMKDYSFSIAVNSELLSLFGPNGENLLKDPLAIRAKIIEDTRGSISSILPKDLQGIGDVQLDARKREAERQRRIATGTATEEDTGKNGWDTFWQNFGTAQAIAATQGGLAFKAQEDFEAATSVNLDPEQIGAFVARSTLALQTQQEMVDSLQIEYERRIANAKAAGDLAEAVKLEKEFAEARNKLMLENEITVKEIQKIILSSTNAENILEQFRVMTEEMFKDDPIGKALLTANEKKLDALPDEKEVVIRAALLSGDLSPTALDSLLSGPSAQKNVDLLVKLGAAGYGQAENIAALFGDETVGVTIGPDDARTGKKTQVSAAERFRRNMDSMDPAEAMQYQQSFNSVIQSMSALGEDGLQMGMAFYLENPELLTEANSKIDEFKERAAKEPITMKLVQEVYGQDMVDKIAQNQEYFDKLPDDQKIIYTTVLKMLGEMDEEAKRIMAINYSMGAGANAFKKQSGGMNFKEANKNLGSVVAGAMATGNLENNYATTVTEAAGKTPETKNTNTNTGGNKTDPLDSLLAKLKQVREAGVNAAGGLAELNKWLSGKKNMTQFDGLEQQLLKLGKSVEFIDFAKSLDPEEQKKYFKVTSNGVVKLTKDAASLQKAFNEIAIGDFQLSMQKSIVDSNNQVKAFNKLISGGMTYEQALDAVADSALAAAVASKSFSDKELKKVVKAAQDAERALKRLRAIEASKTLDDDIKSAAAEADVRRRFFRNEDTKFNELQQFAIVDDPELSRIYTDYLQGLLGKDLPAKFGERLRQIINDPEFQEKFFNSAFGMAMEAFSVLETEIQLDFELGTNISGENIDNISLKKLRSEIQDAEKEIADIAFEIDDLDAGLFLLSEQEDKINETYEKRFEALDRIEKANDTLIRQQKSQLTLADALSQGDIAAAARAAQEMRADAASGSIQSQREMLERSQEAQLNALTTTITNKDGVKEVLTREQIESRIKTLQRKIFDIEEGTLEIKQKQVAEAQFLMDRAISTLEVAGKTKSEWEAQKNSIEKAKVSADGYLSVLTAALGMVTGIINGWNALDGKVVKTTHIIEEKVVRTEDKDPYKIMTDSPLAVANKEYFEKVIDEVADGTANISMIIDYANAVNDALGTPGAQVAMASGGMVKGYARGGKIPKYMSAGGGFRSLGTDIVPAMLTPGEFVVRKYAVDNFGTDKLKAINNGTYRGDSMYNYEVNVSVQTDANPDQIARAVMGQIRQIDAQRIRGNRF